MVVVEVSDTVPPKGRLVSEENRCGKGSILTHAPEQPAECKSWQIIIGCKGLNTLEVIWVQELLA